MVCKLLLKVSESWARAAMQMWVEEVTSEKAGCIYKICQYMLFNFGVMQVGSSWACPHQGSADAVAQCHQDMCALKGLVGGSAMFAATQQKEDEKKREGIGSCDCEG